MEPLCGNNCRLKVVNYIRKKLHVKCFLPCDTFIGIYWLDVFFIIRFEQELETKGIILSKCLFEITFKGCVGYIFASFFFKYKRELL